MKNLKNNIAKLKNQKTTFALSLVMQPTTTNTKPTALVGQNLKFGWRSS